jgi:Zn-dependent protease with chaperone function
MHLSMILAALLVACLLRWFWPACQGNRTQRWYVTLCLFVFPPLLFLTTSVAVICMGGHGSMWGLPVGWIGYSIAVGFLALTGLILLQRLWQSWNLMQLVLTYPVIEVAGQSGHLLNSPALFAGQVGFWRSQLMISQGLLDQFNLSEIQAVLTHEQAHDYYRDTFWFFWLGWLRQITAWLPKTETLWQELRLLRECRADAWAAQQVDPLLLAETLVRVVRDTMQVAQFASIAFGDATATSHLEERVEALINPEPTVNSFWTGFTAGFLILGLLPLLTIPFHT